MFPEITRDDIFRLETPRLWLRWPRAADAEAIARFAGDPDVALKTANIPYPYESRHADRHIIAMRAANTTGEGLCLAMALKRQPNDLIGLINVMGAANRGASALGYWLGKPFWGQGLMTEAATAFVELVFNVSAVGEINSTALPSNAASLRVLEKVGFEPTGTRVIVAPRRGGEITISTATLKRGIAHSYFGARRAKLTST
ncbi:MAG: GNAT family N-acetyltransferase [Methylocystis sp.]